MGHVNGLYAGARGNILDFRLDPGTQHRLDGETRSLRGPGLQQTLCRRLGVGSVTQQDEARCEQFQRVDDGGFARHPVRRLGERTDDDDVRVQSLDRRLRPVVERGARVLDVPFAVEIGKGLVRAGLFDDGIELEVLLLCLLYTSGVVRALDQAFVAGLGALNGSLRATRPHAIEPNRVGSIAPPIQGARA